MTRELRKRCQWLAVVSTMVLLVTVAACGGAEQGGGRAIDEEPNPNFLVPLDAFYEHAAVLADGYKLPPGGAARVELMEVVVMDIPTLEFRIAFGVACQWHRYWQDLVSSGDTQGAQKAASTVLSIPTWPVLQRMDQADRFWTAVYEGFPAVDGSRRFTSTNCPGVRLYLPAPGVPQMTDRTIAILAREASDAALWIDPSERMSAIDRLLPEIPLPDGTSLDYLSDWPERQTDLELASVVGKHAWCHTLGAYIDAADGGDRTAADELASSLLTYLDHAYLTAADFAGWERDVRQQVIDGVSAGIPLWPVTEYQGNCYAIDVERDLRLATHWIHRSRDEPEGNS